MYLVKAGSEAFQLQAQAGGWLLDGQPISADVITAGPDRFQVLWAGRSVNAELLHVEPTTKTFTFRINNTLQQVQVLDRFDQLLETMGLSQAVGRQVQELKAPMPGRIAELRATVGQAVAAGEVLLILEAMKMENALKAPTTATIAAIEVQPGQVVEKNQVLVRFAD